MFIRTGFLAVLGALFATNSFALDDYTNYGFYHRCRKISFEDKSSYCNGPFEAFLKEANKNGRVGRFCPPVQEVSMRQYANTYFRWVENNPKYTNDDFFWGISMALSDAFPCNNNGAQQ